jgi:hypothetical protein
MKKAIASAALVFCVLAAWGQKPDWKNYEYAQDGFAITSPFPPKLEKQLVDTDAGKMELHDYTVNVSPSWAITVSVNDISKFGDLPPRDLLQAAKNGSAAESKSQIVSEKEISLEGAAGLEYELANADSHSRVRCYYAGGRTITVLSGGPAGSPFSPFTDRFFNSLRFLPAWKEYAYASDGFALLAPSPPSLKEKSVDTPAGKAVMHMYTIGLGGDSGVMLSVTDYGSQAKIPPESLSKVKEATLQSVNGKLLNEKNISLDSNPGIEFEMTGSDGYHARSRYYVVGNKLLAIVSYSGEGRPLPPDTTRMLDSLRLLKPQ